MQPTSSSPTAPPTELPPATPRSTAGGWVQGPTPDSVAEHLRSLELMITRRLDGVLHGNHQGLTPGHGSEPGESRLYQPGDDVRRIDWNVTARTNETYIREQIADRDLLAWLVVDVSATMDFGTQQNDKAQTAMAAAATVGFLTARAQNRLGAVLVAGRRLHVMPPRAGVNQVRAILASLASAPPADGAGLADLAGAIDRVGAIANRRGFVAVVSDFTGEQWIQPLGRAGLRHELLALVVSDPREFDVPPIGLVQLVDPSTGHGREVRVTAKVQRRFAEAAAEERARRLAGLRRAHAEIVELSTADDWLASIITHVQRKRVQAVRGGVMPR
ncbi:DUF58 domain-containing protein [Ilumatobacter nonamiensis]|uniref:DUF58 domain-containing protein n=1 Tax=Ilumatobacter nonamiensis TaxID=467093 RepID=UPI0003497864|nr:DUF58 domain-containing protein [Ilumatobacter nonamiensis]